MHSFCLDYVLGCPAILLELTVIPEHHVKATLNWTKALEVPLGRWSSLLHGKSLRIFLLLSCASYQSPAGDVWSVALPSEPCLASESTFFPFRFTCNVLDYRCGGTSKFCSSTRRLRSSHNEYRSTGSCSCSGRRVRVYLCISMCELVVLTSASIRLPILLVNTVVCRLYLWLNSTSGRSLRQKLLAYGMEKDGWREETELQVRSAHSSVVSWMERLWSVCMHM